MEYTFLETSPNESQSYQKASKLIIKKNKLINYIFYITYIERHKTNRNNLTFKSDKVFNITNSLPIYFFT